MQQYSSFLGFFSFFERESLHALEKGLYLLDHLCSKEIQLLWPFVLEKVIRLFDVRARKKRYSYYILAKHNYGMLKSDRRKNNIRYTMLTLFFSAQMINFAAHVVIPFLNIVAYIYIAVVLWSKHLIDLTYLQET